MSQDRIVVTGARENNLKNLTVVIPRDRLVVITGLSGSGKSSLAFDTIYAEGQRRYVESLSAYARQFLGQMDKPDVDHIDGLSPAVSIDQKSASKNPRSTVGTVTEIYDYLRILYARAGTPFCPNGHGPIRRQSTDQITEVARDLPEGTKLQILAPVVRGRKGEYKSVLQEIGRSGYVRARVDGVIHEIADDIDLDRYKQHTIEVVVDRIVVKEGVDRRLADSVEAALKIGKGLVTLSYQLPDGAEVPTDAPSPSEDGTRDALFSEHYACPECGFSMPELEPRMFSFNSPYGACPDCTGLGTKTEFDPELICPDPSQPLRTGAIKPFLYKSGEAKEWWPEMLDGVGAACGFDASLPVSEIPAEGLLAVWEGLSEPIEVVMRTGRSERRFKTEWTGVLSVLRKRYQQTESDWVKRDLDQYTSTKPCPSCLAKRLKPETLSVELAGRHIADVTQLSVEEAVRFFGGLPGKLSARQRTIGERAVKEIIERLRFLQDVGLGYLTLDRSARTLAGGEAQRIRLATQIGSGLMGCLYILDEPSVGLHQRDNRKLIETLKRLRDIGNTVLVVEHDEETILAADHVIELGPGAGEHGGWIVAEGPVDEFLKTDCATAQYLTGRKRIEFDSARRPTDGRSLRVAGARGNNLKDITLDIPLRTFVCVTGVSGSGKSTLIQDTLFPRLMFEIYGTRAVWSPHDEVSGLEHLDKVIDIDQSPIGRTPRSNPATYTGTFDLIREIFAMTQDAKIRGYRVGRFSFNVRGGRCEACKGDGIIKIEMHFLPDVYVPCEVCKGKRYNRETLEVRYKGKNVSEVLDMTIEEACDFFAPIPKIHRKLTTLQEVGLGYIRMGQPATTLSGGEAQRIKLAAELSKRGTGQTVYILDEPTTGLHFEDVRRLLGVLHRLVDQGNTVIVIEHNLDVIKTADWIIDLGPEGGDGGGHVVASGTPEQIAKAPGSHTGRYLAEILAGGRAWLRTPSEAGTDLEGVRA
ncbi:MAG: excinuclease ABC subunit UvrA [Fimbriimonas ginsengisoli]|uniref:UvrABC system protein A n=1 Tax=Fimbriimonas ginsengisoli TaxID=1005039 RepID=A0A931LU03_FIMGI|nr:excinuclease ABC subunit UvrA [Fimbriimonas ginsengisoli]